MTYGTAPRRVSPGVWVHFDGSPLTPAGSGYWENLYRQGQTDGLGHMVGVKGRLAPGNINLADRVAHPVHNKDGSVSTVRSASITEDGHAVLIPTVVDTPTGRKVVSGPQAIAHYKQTGENLGTFKTEADANAYAEKLHNDQAKAEYIRQQLSNPHPNPQQDLAVLGFEGASELANARARLRSHISAVKTAPVNTSQRYAPSGPQSLHPEDQGEGGNFLGDIGHALGTVGHAIHKTADVLYPGGGEPVGGPAYQAGADVAASQLRSPHEIYHNPLQRNEGPVAPGLRSPSGQPLHVSGTAGVPWPSPIRAIGDMVVNPSILPESLGNLPKRTYRLGGAEITVPAARSRTGRALETMADRARPASSKVPFLAKSEAEKFGQELGYSSRFQQELAAVPIDALRRIGRKLDDPQEYALRIVAEGVPPADRAAEHLQWAAQSERPDFRLYHEAHASLIQKASQYITEAGGAPVLRPDAPAPLREAWDLFQHVGKDVREKLLLDLGKITDERIAERLHGPARIFAGGRYQKHEDSIRQALEADPGRQAIQEALQQSGIPEVQQRAHMALMDAAVRSHMMRAGVPAEQGLYSRIEGVVRPDELPPEIQALYQGKLTKDHYQIEDLGNGRMGIFLRDPRTGAPLKIGPVRMGTMSRKEAEDWVAERVQPPAGYVRLYRGEGPGGPGQAGSHGGAWFTTDRDHAEQYARHGNLLQVDVPEDVALSHLQGYLKHYGSGPLDPAASGEFTLPPEWIKKAVPISASSFAQRGGTLDIPSTYGIKGFTQFTPDAQKALIGLTEHADTTTMAHEFAHVIRRFGLLGKNEKKIAKWAGAQGSAKTGYTWTREAEEKFAKGVEAYIRTGVGPTPVQQAFRSLSPAFREVYEHADLPDLSPQAIKTLEKLFSYKKVPGGRIMGADDIMPGQAYAPQVRGMPVRRLSQPHQAMAAYFQRGRQLLSGGRHRAIGAEGPRDEALAHEYTGSLLLSGFFTPDVIKPLVDRAMVATRMAAFRHVHDILSQAGSELPHDASDIAIWTDPLAKNTKKREALKVLWDKMQTAESSGHKLNAKDLEGVDFPLTEQMREAAFPGQIDGRPTAEVAAEILDTKQPIDGLVWVPRDVLEQTGLLYSPAAARLARSGLSKQSKAILRGAGLSWDSLNDLMKAQILYFNPAYIPVNLTGNLVMNLMHQGAYMPVNLWRSVLMHRDLSVLDRLTLDRGMGSGLVGSAGMRTSPGQFLHATLGQWINQAVDVIPRRAAFLHEARRAGYRTTEDLQGLLKGVRDGDKEALDHFELIARAARDAIVDFDRMSPFEREVVARWIFFYPWLRGATRYSIRFIADHPLQAAGIAMAYEHAQATAHKQLGDRPNYASLSFPISTETLGLKGPGFDVGLDKAVGKHTWTDAEGHPMVASLRQAFTQTTPLELAQQGVAFATGRNPEAAGEIVSHLTPVPYATGEALFGYDPFHQHEVPPGLNTFVASFSPKGTPLGNDIKRIFMSPEERKNYRSKAINPRTQGQEIARTFGGSIAPAPYNVEIGHNRALENKGALERKTQQLIEETKKLGLAPPSAAEIEDLNWFVKLDKAVKRGMTPHEKYQVAAKLYDERFGTHDANKYTPQTEGQAETWYLELRKRLTYSYTRLETEVNHRLGTELNQQPVGG